jgi:hypothetical protein
VTGQQRCGRKSPISAGKRIFLCCLSHSSSSISSSPASRQGKPIERFQSTQPHHSPSHNHIDCRISSFITEGSQEPGWRRCCSARGMAQTLCFSDNLAGRAGASATRTGGAAVWYGVLFVAAWLETTQNTSAGVSRRPDCVIHCGIPCAMQYAAASYRNRRASGLLRALGCFVSTSHAHS